MMFYVRLVGLIVCISLSARVGFAELILKIADVSIQQSETPQLVEVPVYGLNHLQKSMQAFNLLFDVGGDNNKVMPNGFSFTSQHVSGGETSKGSWVLTTSVTSNLPNQNFDLLVYGDSLFSDAIPLVQSPGKSVYGAHLFSLRILVGGGVAPATVPIHFATYFPLPAVFDNTTNKLQMPFAANGLQAGSITVTSTAIPEPSTVLLVSLSFGSILPFLRKKRTWLPA